MGLFAPAVSHSYQLLRFLAVCSGCDLPLFGPSFITRICGFEIGGPGDRHGTARRARDPRLTVGRREKGAWRAICASLGHKRSGMAQLVFQTVIHAVRLNSKGPDHEGFNLINAEIVMN